MSLDRAFMLNKRVSKFLPVSTIDETMEVSFI
jgi:hypothetical protein